MKKVFGRPKSLKKAVFHYCPGCGHSIIHRITCEVIDELGIQEKVIGVPPPGCSVFAYYYFDVDMVESAHGRGAAVATGIKRAYPESIVFTYQGDGDLSAIGTTETLHAANRGENITAIFINNAVYGMTGGQMAPTTLLGMQTTTSPYGRDDRIEGHPIKMSEILAQVKGTCYIERVAVNSPANIRKAKKAIKKAFQCQIDGLGYSLVEILSPCPTNWKKSSIEAFTWIDDVMAKEFPLGIIKDTTGKRDAD
ncbi:MAG TPA: thiamine pyrophosphate-dependent enzyme [Thermodesulfobacteriota bacterium]|nr:2-oxoglutarate oxidoreductase [Deltaproteobacteria bacterium]HOC38131.1 thiamine pyrophosphate-dependent enzyme [Thermodesulfobacteriota bacterium]